MKGIVILDEWHDVITTLEPEEQVAVYDAIFATAYGRPMPELSGNARVAFGFCKNGICRFRDKYEQTSQRRAEAAKKRWTEKQPDANAYNCIQDKDKDKNKDKDKDILTDVSREGEGESLDLNQFAQDIRPLMADWARHLSTKGIAATPITLAAHYDEARSRGCDTIDKLTEAIRFSIARGYKGIYRPKESGFSVGDNGEELLTYAEYTRRAPSHPEGYYTVHPTARDSSGGRMFYHKSS